MVFYENKSSWYLILKMKTTFSPQKFHSWHQFHRKRSTVFHHIPRTSKVLFIFSWEFSEVVVIQQVKSCVRFGLIKQLVLLLTPDHKFHFLTLYGGKGFTFQIFILFLGLVFCFHVGNLCFTPGIITGPQARVTI